MGKRDGCRVSMWLPLQHLLENMQTFLFEGPQVSSTLCAVTGSQTMIQTVSEYRLVLLLRLVVVCTHACR